MNTKPSSSGDEKLIVAYRAVAAGLAQRGWVLIRLLEETGWNKAELQDYVNRMVNADKAGFIEAKSVITGMVEELISHA